ncbi:MAG: hypothetical protein B6245_04475 [Desulfobacteraceae bacterium 4572_88]|nr:MAG: hypothetical protein B6245_04475 [Desulfobacteraceae bacterium 4572_88]
MELIISQVSQSLNLPLSTLERWIRQGRIPVSKKEGTCVFRRSVLEKWAVSHNLSFSLPEKNAKADKKAQPETLLSAMKRGGVLHRISGDNGNTVLRSAVDQMGFLPEAVRGELYDKLLERERLTSTGIGKGVAIPHPRAPLSENADHPLITTCFLGKPIHFRAVDDKPVFVLFILLSASTKAHLHLLSRLAFCVRNNAFVEFLRTAPDADALLSKVAKFEEQLDAHG